MLAESGRCGGKDERRSKAHACRKQGRVRVCMCTRARGSALGGKGGRARVQVHGHSDNEIKHFIACAKKLATRAHAQREPAASAYVLPRFKGGSREHFFPQMPRSNLLPST